MVLCSQTGYHVARNVCRFQFLRFLSSDQQKYVSARKNYSTFEKRAPGVKGVWILETRARFFLASHAGVFRGARISFLPIDRWLSLTQD